MKHTPVHVYSLLIVGFIAIMCVIVSLGQGVLSPEAQQLRDMLIHPACQRACILGIESEVSTFQQVVDILDQEQIAYEIFPRGIDATYENSEIGFTYTLAPNLEPNLLIGVAIRDNIVQQIFLGLKIPVSTVTEAFGSPDVILRHPLESDPLHSQELPMLYLDEGIAFRVVSGAGFVPDTVYGVVLADPESAQGNYMNGFPGEPVDQPCTTFGIAPCIVSTATPSASPTLTPIASAQAQAEELYDLLTDPNCEKACYMGIEPGITTATEVETILSNNGISLDIIPLIGEDRFYTWQNNVTEPFVDPNSRITLSVSGQNTTQLSINLTVPIETVLEAFGNPNEVKGLTDANGSVYGLIYPDLNLVFNVSNNSGLDFANAAAIAPIDAPYTNLVNGFPGSAVNEPCLSYGIAPCIAPTATPAPPL